MESNGWNIRLTLPYCTVRTTVKFTVLYFPRLFFEEWNDKEKNYWARIGEHREWMSSSAHPGTRGPLLTLNPTGEGENPIVIQLTLIQITLTLKFPPFHFRSSQSIFPYSFFRFWFWYWFSSQVLTKYYLIWWTSCVSSICVFKWSMPRP